MCSETLAELLDYRKPHLLPNIDPSPQCVVQFSLSSSNRCFGEYIIKIIQLLFDNALSDWLFDSQRK